MKKTSPHKLLTRVLVNYWRDILPNIIISPEQTTFVGGRNIADSIVLLQELWNHITRRLEQRR